MAIYECPACGHKCKCPLAHDLYEDAGFQFFCFGDKILHGSNMDKKVENYMNHFRPSEKNHPPIEMGCVDSRFLSLEILDYPKNR